MRAVSIVDGGLNLRRQIVGDTLQLWTTDDFHLSSRWSVFRVCLIVKLRDEAQRLLFIFKLAIVEPRRCSLELLSIRTKVLLARRLTRDRDDSLSSPNERANICTPFISNSQFRRSHDSSSVLQIRVVARVGNILKIVC